MRIRILIRTTVVRIATVIEKCNLYIKVSCYFDEIKCYADRPYLVFSELKPETHTYIFFFFFFFFFWPNSKYSTYPQHSGERYRTNGPLVSKCCKNSNTTRLSHSLWVYVTKNRKGTSSELAHFKLSNEADDRGLNRVKCLYLQILRIFGGVLRSSLCQVNEDQFSLTSR